MGADAEAPMDSEEIEALEEEQKLVDSMIKKGTMQKQVDRDENGANGEGNGQEGSVIFSYEKSKLYR